MADSDSVIYGVYIKSTRLSTSTKFSISENILLSTYPFTRRIEPVIPACFWRESIFF